MTRDPKTLIDRLEALRDAWAIKAHTIDEIYGDDSPEAKVFRMCIRDVHAIVDDQMQ